MRLLCTEYTSIECAYFVFCPVRKPDRQRT